MLDPYARQQFMINTSVLYLKMHEYKKPSISDFVIKSYGPPYVRTEITIPIFIAPPNDSTSILQKMDLMLIYIPID